MAILDFPPSPATGTLYPNPAVQGQPQYTYDGEKWVSGTGGGAIYISDSAPAAPVGSLWWESDTSILYIRFFDGDSTQWCQVLNGPADAVRFGTAQSLTAPQQAQARQNILSVAVVRIQKFTASGTYTPHPNMVSCIVECLGGGGAGGGVGGAVSVLNVGGGGGGGGYARVALVGATQVGGAQTVTIGAGGTGVSNAVGNNGGTTAFGAFCSAGGGGGGGHIAVGCGGGVGGAGTVGDVIATGASGQGGAWGVSGSANILCGVGGSSMFGGGGRSVLVGGGGVAGAGQPGAGYGSGGAGAGASNHASNAAGGPGSPGIVIITEYCTQ